MIRSCDGRKGVLVAGDDRVSRQSMHGPTQGGAGGAYIRMTDIEQFDWNNWDGKGDEK
jgi:hypothetical protein